MLSVLGYDINYFVAKLHFRVAYKQEYEKYKMVNVIIIFIFSVTALFSDHM